MRTSGLIIVLCALAVGVGITSSNPAAIARGASLAVTYTAAAADVNGDWNVDQQDLMLVVRRFNTSSSGGAREDVNQDGVVDVLDWPSWPGTWASPSPFPPAV